jgi:hypothetical protein
MRDAWADLEEGYVVVREVGHRNFIISWYPYDEGHPEYPGHTIASSDFQVPPVATLEDAISWACLEYAGSRARMAA